MPTSDSMALLLVILDAVSLADIYFDFCLWTRICCKHNAEG